MLHVYITGLVHITIPTPHHNFHTSVQSAQANPRLQQASAMSPKFNAERKAHRLRVRTQALADQED
jgi:hypothetical protein